MAKKKKGEEVKDEKKLPGSEVEKSGEVQETIQKNDAETSIPESSESNETEKEVEKGQENTPDSTKDEPIEESDAGKEKVKPIYKKKSMQSMYDELRADGKTNTQARQIVSLKHKK